MVITCEHASRRVPRPLRVSRAERPILDTHWASDIGAANVAREVARRTGSVAVLARFSRLVCDPNRPIDDPTWIRDAIDGKALSFNQNVTLEERRRRRQTYYGPYHDAVDAVLTERLALGGQVLLLAVHSFTPVLGDSPRDMEIGILFDDHEATARRLARALENDGFRIALNAPYSGLDGTIFAAQRHGRMHGVIYLEIEVRQDLIATAPRARVIGRRVADALERLAIRRPGPDRSV